MTAAAASIDIVEDDYGVYKVPHSFVRAASGKIRNNGWIDRRFKVSKAIEGYLRLNQKQRAEAVRSGNLDQWKAPEFFA